MMSVFDEHFIVRVSMRQGEEVDEIVRRYPLCWENRSEFVRAAISRFVGEIKSGRFDPVTRRYQ